MGFGDKEGLYRRFTRLYHVIGAVGTLGVAYIFCFERNVTSPQKEDDSIFDDSLFSSIAFVFCFASSFGMTLWVTFVAGVMMYKYLPKHTFGYIQSKLFPVYFFNATLFAFIQLVIVAMELKKFHSINKEHLILVIALSTLFVSSLVNGVWAGPKSSAIMFKRHKLEKEDGSNAAELLETNEEYRKLCKKFGTIHGVSALLNMFSLFANVYVLYWISLQLFKYSTSTMIHAAMGEA